MQHLRSHHKNVATLADPSTARLGESLYGFFWRAIPKGYFEVWDIEVERLKQAGYSGFSLVLYNKLVIFNVGHALYLWAIYWLFGGLAAAFHIFYSVLVVILLETINYIEHYGLLRKELPGGVYEPVKITHSWNAP